MDFHAPHHESAQTFTFNLNYVVRLFNHHKYEAVCSSLISKLNEEKPDRPGKFRALIVSQSNTCGVVRLVLN